MKADEVECYEVLEDRVIAGEYPVVGKKDLSRRRLEFLIAKGVSTFIDLTAKEDRLFSYDGMLSDLGVDFKYLNFPIPDRGVPESDEFMNSILLAIRQEVNAGRTCYVHCLGGIGRTGTVVGCLFREQGLGPDEALEKVQQLYSAGMPKVDRHPHSPQTPGQFEYVRAWRV